MRDYEWAEMELEGFISAVDGWMGNSFESPDSALEAEPIALRIMNKVDSGLGDFEVDDFGGFSSRLQEGRNRAVRALGLIRKRERLDKFEKSEAPSLAADAMHPWVWGSARQLWDAEAYQDAVGSSARTINARLQQKLGRHDISELDLINQAFSDKAPEVGKPRLRFPGDRSDPRWSALQNGARSFGAGCFQAIRNRAAHDEETGWTKHEALEYLAAFSILARWIEICEIESA
jgi:uncharacterized protein (TIGR02391 family)